MAKIKLMAKENTSIALQDCWYEAEKGHVLSGEMFGGVIVVCFRTDLDEEEYGIFKRSELEEHFTIEIIEEVQN